MTKPPQTDCNRPRSDPPIEDKSTSSISWRISASNARHRPAGRRAPRLCRSLALAREIAEPLKIRPNCAARTAIQDIDPILRYRRQNRCEDRCRNFLGSSMIRQYVENWTMDELMRRTEEAVTYASAAASPCDVRHGRYHPRLSRDDQTALHDRNQLRRPSYRV